MKKERLRQLVLKYSSGNIEKSELDELLDYVVINGENPDLQRLLSELLDATVADADLQLDAESLYQRIINEYEDVHTKKSPSRIKWWWYGAAAILLLAIGIWMTGGDALLNDGTSGNAVVRTITTAPTDRPLLRLANGRTINLDSAINGVLAVEEGVQVRLHDNALYYTATSEEVGNEHLKNTIVTPKGSQYQVVLPDGSKLWLNAASTVSYPLRFAREEREITVSGEVYLEVEHAADWPFVVHTAMQEIEVLGTRFNVSAYPDDLTTKTTLVDGRVKVSSPGDDAEAAREPMVLMPGQQVVSKAGHPAMRMNTVDPEEIVSWKENLFVFSNEEISEVMKKVSRWYDVEVAYKDGMAGKRIGGDIPRFDRVEELMDALEYTGLLHYEKKGGIIVIMK